MRKKKHITRLQAACLSLVFLLPAACTTGEMEIGERLPLEITAEIVRPETRADGDTANYDKREFDEGEQIKVYKSGTDISGAVLYKKSGSNWLPVDAGSKLTTTGGERFTASYPTVFTAILSDQTTQVNYWKSNNLVSVAEAVGNRVDFQFKPAAAKITLNIEYTAGSNVTGTGVTVSGNYLLSSTSTETISLLPVTSTGKDHVYIGIVYPGEKSYTITVSASGQNSKTYSQSTITLNPGKNYIYNFTSSNNLILNSVTVADFEEDTGSGTGINWPAT